MSRWRSKVMLMFKCRHRSCGYVTLRYMFVSFFISWATAVASLGWVTPGAATEGVTPLFFVKSRRPFLLIVVTITITFYCFHSGVTPSRMSPTPFLPIRPRFSTILCKFAHKIFFLRVSPPGGCHPRRSAPPVVMPLGDC